jgi:ribosomal protein S18 acetylase RimI-like enzyme
VIGGRTPIRYWVFRQVVVLSSDKYASTRFHWRSGKQGCESSGAKVTCHPFPDSEGWHIPDSDEDPEAARYWFVAVDGGEIAGFVLSRVGISQTPEEAWIYIVGVRPAWRRRGIALALLQHRLWELYQKGKRRVRLEVDTQNPTGATRLYEKAGMHVESRYDFFEKELRSGKN